MAADGFLHRVLVKIVILKDIIFFYEYFIYIYICRITQEYFMKNWEIANLKLIIVL